MKDCEMTINSLFLTIMCFPPNCTALLQPMDQNVINLTKLHYKRSLLAHVVGSKDFEKAMKEVNLRHAVQFLYSGWKNLCPTKIAKCFRAIMPSSEEWDSEDNIPLSELRLQYQSSSSEMEILQSMLNIISPQEFFSNDEITDWVLDKNFESQNQNVSDEESEAEIPEALSSQPKVKCEDAIKSFDTCLKWAEQNEVDTEHIIVLQNLKEKAVLLKSARKAQTKIFDFFQNMY